MREKAKINMAAEKGVQKRAQDPGDRISWGPGHSLQRDPASGSLRAAFRQGQ